MDMRFCAHVCQYICVYLCVVGCVRKNNSDFIPALSDRTHHLLLHDSCFHLWLQLCPSKINKHRQHKNTIKEKMKWKVKESCLLLYLASEGHGMLSCWILDMRKKEWKDKADVWRTERWGNKSNGRENGEERQKWNLFKKSNTCLWLTLADMRAYANLGTNKQNKKQWLSR